MKRTLLILLSTVTGISAQLLQFGNGQLPACAQQCDNLTNAQAACYPTSDAPVLCFCQSGYLKTLKNTPEGTCDATCTSETDRQQIYSWYAGYCANGGASASASLAAAAAATASATTFATQATAQAPSATASTTAPAQSTGGSSSSATTSGIVADQNENKSWWDLHARWIAMVIVLVIGFAIIIVLGLWLKKRYLRKRDQTMLNGAPTGWAPPSKDQHAAGGYGRNNEKNVSQAGSKATRQGRNKSGAITKLQNLERKIGGR